MLKDKSIFKNEKSSVFLVQEQSETNKNKYFARYMMITDGALLLFDV